MEDVGFKKNGQKNLKKQSLPERCFRSLGRFFVENMGILIGLFVICLLLTIFTDSFFKSKNFFNVLRQVSTNLYVAIPMTLIIILGGIDLSVGSTIALSGVVTGGLIAFNHTNTWVAVGIGILVGVLVGAFNGVIISKTTIPAFIVTLSTMNIARGAAYIYTGGQPIRVMSNHFNAIGSGYVGEIPNPVIYLAVLIILSYFMMNTSKLGRHIYAVGGNPTAAKFAGIKTSKVIFFAYVFSGLMAGISGVVLASRMFSGQPTAGDGAELDAIAAVVLGGTSMSGGVGKIGGTVIGGLVIGVLSNGLNLLGVNSFWQFVVKGVVILIAVFADYIKKTKRA